MNLLKAIFLWVSCLFGLSKKFFENQNKKIRKLGWEIPDASKEHYWYAVDHYDITYVQVTLSPRMSWPEIHQAIRFIVKYKKKVLVCFDRGGWIDSTDAHKKAYGDWLILLLNRYEIPRNIVYSTPLDVDIQLIPERNRWIVSFSLRDGIKCDCLNIKCPEWPIESTLTNQIKFSFKLLKFCRETVLMANTIKEKSMLFYGDAILEKDLLKYQSYPAAYILSRVIKDRFLTIMR